MNNRICYHHPFLTVGDLVHDKQLCSFHITVVCLQSVKWQWSFDNGINVTEVLPLSGPYKQKIKNNINNNSVTKYCSCNNCPYNFQSSFLFVWHGMRFLLFSHCQGQWLALTIIITWIVRELVLTVPTIGFKSHDTLDRFWRIFEHPKAR